MANTMRKTPLTLPVCLALGVVLSSYHVFPVLGAGKEPLLIFSYDYNDFRHDARGIREMVDMAKNAGFGRIHYRILDSEGYDFRPKTLPAATALNRVGGPGFDPLRVAVEYAHARGMQLYAYIDPFENIGPMRDFGNAHLDLCLVDRTGRPWWGALCWAYPEVRRYLQTVVEELGVYDLDGYYFETSSSHGGSVEDMKVGYNQPIVDEYRHQTGVDIRTQPFDRVLWKKIQGGFFSQGLREWRRVVHPRQQFSLALPRTQRIPMNQMPIVDWRPLVEERVIDELVLGEYRSEYTYWHTDVGHRRAAELADFCHRHGVRFCPYTYTDVLHEYTWRRLGPEAVRQRMFGEIAFLKDTGADCFTNRNLPEFLPIIGCPPPQARFQRPVASYFWSAFREAVRSSDAVRPPWAEPLPGKDAPVVLVILPQTHEADSHSETYRGAEPTFRGLLARLGCRMEPVTTQDELERALAQPRKFVGIVFGYNWSRNPWLVQWVAEKGGQILEAVRDGVSLIACHSLTTDAPLEKLLGIGVVDLRTVGGGQGFTGMDLHPNPMCRSEDMPARIDLNRTDWWSVYWWPDLGTSCLDLAQRPTWPHEIAGTVTGKAGRQLPAAIAGTLGKGRVFYSTSAITEPPLLFVDPFCGPNADDLFRLWLAIARRAFQPASVPAIAMLRDHQSRLARFEANRLVNGDFEQPPADGLVPGWFAESRTKPPTPVAIGQGIRLDDTIHGHGQRALRLDTASVQYLTSLGVPVDPGQPATFSAVLRADRPGQKIQVQLGHAQNGQAQFDLSDTWQPISLTFRSVQQPDHTGPVPVWITITFSTPGGTVWIDDARMTSAAMRPPGTK